MRLRLVSVVSVLLLWALTAGPAGADEVLLRDGSRLIGTVTAVTGEAVVVKTDFAGELSIAREKVQGVTTAEAVNVATGEDVLERARLTYDPASGQRIEPADGASREIELERLAEAWAQGRQRPSEVRRREAEEKARPKWTATLEAGVAGQTGNTEQTSATGRAEVKRTSPTDRLKLYAAGLWAQEDGEETAREILGGADLEVDISESWFAFGTVELENDKFEEIDLRATAAAGVGYFFIQTNDEVLKVRGGPGVLYEKFREGGEEWDAIAEVALIYERSITPWLAFEHETKYYPTFEELGDFRLLIRNAIEVPLDKDKTWKIKAGVRNHYDAMPQDDVERLDTFYFVNLAYEME